MACWVVKTGGALCETAEGRARVVQACAALKQPYVLVHGGGVLVSRMQHTLGCETQFVEGRRVTTEENMRVVERVLSGDTNPSLVRAFVQHGIKAVGVSGCDNGMIRCEQLFAWGHVGIPSSVDPSLLHLLLKHGYTPIVSPVSMGESGACLNVNADDVACALAQALGAERLLFVSDVEGVRCGDAVLAKMTCSDVEKGILEGWVSGGMVPKLRAAQRVVQSGVREVFMCSIENGLLCPGGTRIVCDETGVENVA